MDPNSVLPKFKPRADRKQQESMREDIRARLDKLIDSTGDYYDWLVYNLAEVESLLEKSNDHLPGEQ